MDEHVVIIVVKQQVAIATVCTAKNTVNYSFRGLYLKNGTVKYVINV